MEPEGQSAQSDLERAYEAMEVARTRRDPQGMSAANREIRAIRERIHSTRRKLASLAAERIHLIEVIERARLQLLRYERHLEDHDRRIASVREELQRMGGRAREHPNFSSQEEEDLEPRGE
jgi:chromosome segregation ATPase